MFERHLSPNAESSFFLFGPRGAGKTHWADHAFPDAVRVDLLESETYRALAARPERLEEYASPRSKRALVVLDEVQRIPALLDEVHRLIEKKRLRFVLTGSSARKLRRGGANLLAGRARTRFMHPLTAEEVGKKFSIEHALRFGMLPTVWVDSDPKEYLASYAAMYVDEEVRQEGLTRNIGAFSRFLEVTTLSQGQPLNVSSVARDCAVNRKVVEDYFAILQDLLLSVHLPVFHRRAKRALVAHPKFYWFDTGVYRALRPRGPLDVSEEIDGAALETLVLQHLRALNDTLDLGYSIHYWRSRGGLEVDFVLYGERGLHAIEVKRSRQPRPQDLSALSEFGSDYPAAKLCLFYGGKTKLRQGNIDIVPVDVGLKELRTRIGG
jgi:uncharacterized protein